MTQEAAATLSCEHTLEQVSDSTEQLHRPDLRGQALL